MFPHVCFCARLYIYFWFNRIFRFDQTRASLILHNSTAGLTPMNISLQALKLSDNFLHIHVYSSEFGVFNSLHQNAIKQKKTYLSSHRLQKSKHIYKASILDEIILWLTTNGGVFLDLYSILSSYGCVKSYHRIDLGFSSRI